MKFAHRPSAPPDPSAGYERSDMSIRAIVTFMIGFVVFIGVAHVIIMLMFGVLERTVPAPVTPLSAPVVQVNAPVVGPQLEVDPSYNWGQMRAAQARVLGLPPHESSGYGWVSPERGVVRIPIGRAMELALERGFPVRPAGEGEKVRQPGK